MKVINRAVDADAEKSLIASDISPLLARLLAARGVKSATEFSHALNQLIPPEQLTNNTAMAILLADAIQAGKKMLIVGDYDADGATATAVAMQGLRQMGAEVDFLVPNRFEYSYGLTPEIVMLAAKSSPHIIITVDNGIASVEGVAAANALGMQVLITDHHLPAETSPQAACIVNPNQHGCSFPSKHLAGVGVMFYVLLALRAELRNRGTFANKVEPKLVDLLDLVALGTVVDLVKLDANNRILVDQGLRRIRAGACSFGIQALLKIAGRDLANTNAQDLGFYVGPRLNAAGRLDDMRLGIQCLLAENESEAAKIAQTLHELNAERRNIEADMQESALAALVDVEVADQFSICLFENTWHQGVVGILASRIKERYHRPVIAFAEAEPGILKGSGRSIPGLHLRDALDLVTKRFPEFVIKFGGHAMAAGLTIRQTHFLPFKSAFETVVRECLSPADLLAIVETDGNLEASEMTLNNAQLLDSAVWGQGFAMPTFSDHFEVVSQRILGGKHLKLVLQKQNARFDAIFFGQADLLPGTIHAVYQLQCNSFNGIDAVQLRLNQLV